MRTAVPQAAGRLKTTVVYKYEQGFTVVGYTNMSRDLEVERMRELPDFRVHSSQTLKSKTTE